MAKKTALALLANGSEEMELIVTVDILRRAGVSYSIFRLQNKQFCTFKQFNSVFVTFYVAMLR